MLVEMGSTRENVLVEFRTSGGLGVRVTFGLGSGGGVVLEGSGEQTPLTATYLT